MKFIELKDAFTDNVIYVNVNSITILAPAKCMVDGKCIEGCNVTYNIGSSVSSITIAKTCQEVIATIINHDPITFKGTIYRAPHFSKEFTSTLEHLRNQFTPCPPPQETPQCNGNGTAQKTEE